MRVIQPPTPADQREKVPTIFYRDDFVLVTNNLKCWVVRIDDISLLEAWRNIHSCIFPTFFIVRRSLGDLERKLESSIFFRASRGCIVNLNHVKELPDSSKMDVTFHSPRPGPPRRKVVFTDAFLLQCLHIIARICVQMDGGGLLARKLIPLTRVRPLWDRARKA